MLKTFCVNYTKHTCDSDNNKVYTTSEVYLVRAVDKLNAAMVFGQDFSHNESYDIYIKYIEQV